MLYAVSYLEIQEELVHIQVLEQLSHTKKKEECHWTAKYQTKRYSQNNAASILRIHFSEFSEIFAITFN